MTKKEINELIERKKFSVGLRSFSEDKFSDLIKEIYGEGMREGYNLAIYTLESRRRRVDPDSAADYVTKHKEEIRSILKLCEQYEACSEEDK